MRSDDIRGDAAGDGILSLSRGPRALRTAFRVRMPDARESLSGAAAVQYCGVNEQLTTCEAVYALVNNETCEIDSDCPRAGFVAR